jgi:hypothetical protein
MWWIYTTFLQDGAFTIAQSCAHDLLVLLSCRVKLQLASHWGKAIDYAHSALIGALRWSILSLSQQSLIIDVASWSDILLTVVRWRFQIQVIFVLISIQFFTKFIVDVLDVTV